MKSSSSSTTTASSESESADDVSRVEGSLWHSELKKKKEWSRTNEFETMIQINIYHKFEVIINTIEKGGQPNGKGYQFSCVWV